MAKLVCPLDTRMKEESEMNAPVDSRDVKLYHGPVTELDCGFIHASVNVILKICRLFGFNQKGFNPTPTLRKWEVGALQSGSAMAFVKYKIVAYYSAMHTLTGDFQDPPPIPFGDGFLDLPHVLIGGRAGRWMGKMRSRYRPRCCDMSSRIWESFCETILQSKKGMPRPNKADLDKASHQTFVDLTTPPLGDNTRELLCSTMYCDMISKWCPDSLSWESIEVVLRRTVRELFVGVRLTNEDLWKPMIPSANAHYNYSRSGFGALGRFFAEERSSLLRGLDLEGQITKLDKGGKGYVLPEYSVSKLSENYRTFFDRVVSLALKEEPSARPLSLPEALKVRTITTGPCAMYFALKPLQKKLWQTVKQNPMFTLIGEKISPLYVQGRMGEKLKEGKKFLSVDYKNATNMINSRASDIVCDEIIKQMDLEPHLAHLFRQSLTGHIIYDPSDKTGKRSAPQRNGQLMGSITSFPILCIVNAAICRWVQELDQQTKFGCRLTLREAKVCVNGDDAVMPVTERGRDLWKKIASFVGLKPSVGKVYYSDFFLNMNSMSFRYRVEPWHRVEGEIRAGEIPMIDVHFRAVPFINLGLMEGLKRSSFKVFDKEDEATIGMKARDLIETCPKLVIEDEAHDVPAFNLREKVLGQFIGKHLEELKSLHLPWFIPEPFGGLGLPCIGKYAPRDTDLRLARKVYENYSLPQRTTVCWPLWKKAEERYPSPKKIDYVSLQEFTFRGGQRPENPLSLEERESRPCSHKELLVLGCLDILMSTDFVAQMLALRECELNVEFWSKNQDSPEHIRCLEVSIAARDRIIEELGSRSFKDNYYTRVRRLLQKALRDQSIPMPEPFGRLDSDDPTESIRYAYPVSYDIHSLPLLQVVMG